MAPIHPYGRPNGLLVLLLIAVVSALAACSPPPVAGPVKLAKAPAGPAPSPSPSPPPPSPSPSPPPPPPAAPAPAPAAAKAAPAPVVAAAPPPPAAAVAPPSHPELFEQARALESPDPETLASRLIEAEQRIASAATSAADLRSAGMVQQAAYRQLIRHEEWRPTVFARLPDALRPVAEANITAGSSLRTLAKPQANLPPWRIVAPPPAEELQGFYRAAEAASGIGWQYLAAIHLVESRMGRIRGTSTAGAQGPMQFLPSTWAAYGEGDINNPRDAIMAAARYLKRNGGPADMAGALFAYNHSRNYVQAIELYAARMRADERAYFGYYHWQVYYRTTAGDALLPEGYGG